jgi:hypothetical protein
VSLRYEKSCVVRSQINMSAKATLEEKVIMKTTTTTTRQDSVQQDCEATRSSGRAELSPRQLSPISMQEEIARLAYSIWENHNCSQGSAEEDWKEAERELRHSAVNNGEISGFTYNP